jgi:hypothetical protein
LAGGAVFTLGGLAVAVYRQIGVFLRAPYVAFTLFCSGVVGVCLIVWLHSGLFSFIKTARADFGSNAVVTSVPLVGDAPLTCREIHEAVERQCKVCALPIVAYALWPLQFDLIRDLVAVAAIIGFISIVPVFGIWWELKVAGRIQYRLGPMRVGGWRLAADTPPTDQADLQRRLHPPRRPVLCGPVSDICPAGLRSSPCLRRGVGLRDLMQLLLSSPCSASRSSA